MLNNNFIGQQIASGRKGKNLSQSDLAQHISVSPQAVGKWERGESMPDILTLNRLAAIFGVDLNYFSEHSPLPPQEIAEKEKKEESTLTKYMDKLGLTFNLTGENYRDADFSGLKNIKEKIAGSSFNHCKLNGADLSDTAFRGTSILSSEFIGADLRNVKFIGSEFKDTSFVQAILIDVNIGSCELRHCDFSEANLSGIEISSSELRNNLFSQTNWQHASFKSTQFTETLFTGLLESCSFTSCSFSKTTFTGVHFSNCFFKYSELKKVNFEQCTADRLSYEFLKNNKAKMDGIQWIP